MSVIDKGVSSLALVGNFFEYCEKLKSMPNEARLGLQNTDRGYHVNGYDARFAPAR